MVMLGTALSMTKLRRWTVSTYATDESVEDWQVWRARALEMADDGGPVRRRQPTTDQPPALIMMRDYFGTCMAGAILFITLLYFVCVIFVRGVFAVPPPPMDDAQEISR